MLLSECALLLLKAKTKTPITAQSRIVIRKT